MVLIHTHLANLGKPGTYAEEVKKGLKGDYLPEVEVPNIMDSASIFNVSMSKNLITKTKPTIPNMETKTADTTEETADHTEEKAFQPIHEPASCTQKRLDSIYLQRAQRVNHHMFVP